jgi:hypothetical protein
MISGDIDSWTLFTDFLLDSLLLTVFRVSVGGVVLVLVAVCINGFSSLGTLLCSCIYVGVYI